MSTARGRRPAAGWQSFATGRQGLATSWQSFATGWRRFSAGLHEFYVGPYRQTFARAEREEDDLFRMLVMSEMLGVPNPAAGFTEELLPVLYDGFHEWHLRMGMDRSPLEGFRCC